MKASVWSVHSALLQCLEQVVEAERFWGRGTSLGLSTAVLLGSIANQGCSLNEALLLLMLHSPSALSDREIRRHCDHTDQQRDLDRLSQPFSLKKYSSLQDLQSFGYAF